MVTNFPADIPLNAFGTAKNGHILCLHANSYSAGLYHDFLKPLATEYELWVPDLPGHGQSRWVGCIQDWSDLADLFIQHLERNPIPRPFIGLGHSIGGIVIMLIAIKRPKWFSRLVLLDPVLLPKHILWLMHGLRLLSLTQLVPLARAANRRRSKFEDRKSALTHYAGKRVFARWQPNFLEAYVDTCLRQSSSGPWQLACTPQLESSIYQSLPLDAWKLLDKITIPCLYLIGNQSDTVNARGRKRLARRTGNRIVKSINGGHLFPFEQPAVSIHYIQEFLAG